MFIYKHFRDSSRFPRRKSCAPATAVGDIYDQEKRSQKLVLEAEKC